MATPIETVNAFIAEWAKSRDEHHASYHRYFTAKTVWENVGVVTTVGAEEALNFIRRFEKRWGDHKIEVDMLGVCADGGTVMTERLDRFVAPDGRELLAVRVMGVFEVENGRIKAWRDYFNPKALGA